MARWPGVLPSKQVTYIVTYLQVERRRSKRWEMVVENAILDMLTNKFGWDFEIYSQDGGYKEKVRFEPRPAFETKTKHYETKSFEYFRGYILQSQLKISIHVKTKGTWHFVWLFPNSAKSCSLPTRPSYTPHNLCPFRQLALWALLVGCQLQFGRFS